MSRLPNDASQDGNGQHKNRVVFSKPSPRNLLRLPPWMLQYTHGSRPLMIVFFVFHAGIRSPILLKEF